MILTIIAIAIFIITGIVIKIRDCNPIPKLLATILFALDILSVMVIFEAASTGLCTITGIPKRDHLQDNYLLIVGALESDDQFVRDYAYEQAVKYNERCNYQKEMLASPWFNWIANPEWKDAEFISIPKY
jgi:hypothetical protein